MSEPAQKAVSWCSRSKTAPPPSRGRRSDTRRPARWTQPSRPPCFRKDANAAPPRLLGHRSGQKPSKARQQTGGSSRLRPAAKSAASTPPCPGGQVQQGRALIQRQVPQSECQADVRRASRNRGLQPCLGRIERPARRHVQRRLWPGHARGKKISGKAGRHGESVSHAHGLRQAASAGPRARGRRSRFAAGLPEAAGHGRPPQTDGGWPRSACRKTRCRAARESH